jgi:hypothetical protein
MISTGDGYFEEAAYRYESNASNPSCIQAIIWWHHGTYRLNNNGSISLSPFPGDGRIQVQNPCAAVTNVITYYDQFTLYADWGIIIDYTTGNYQLRLNRFDGAKLPYVSQLLGAIATRMKLIIRWTSLPVHPTCFPLKS